MSLINQTAAACYSPFNVYNDPIQVGASLNGRDVISVESGISDDSMVGSNFNDYMYYLGITLFVLGAITLLLAPFGVAFVTTGAGIAAVLGGGFGLGTALTASGGVLMCVYDTESKNVVENDEPPTYDQAVPPPSYYDISYRQGAAPSDQPFYDPSILPPRYQE